MKAVLPVQTDNVLAKFSLRFARSEFFALVDTQSSGYEIIKNPFLSQKKGVGKLLMDWLMTHKNINSIIAYEIGLSVQQRACKMKVQLILLNEKNKSLFEILDLLKIKYYKL